MPRVAGWLVFACVLQTACLFPSFDGLVCEGGCDEGEGGGSVGGGGQTTAGSCELSPEMHGPDGVLVAPSNGGPTFCIDRTEVSVAQYAELTSQNFPLFPDPTPAECADVEYGDQDAAPFAAANEMAWFRPIWYTQLYYEGAQDEHDHPMQGVSWCQAQAFCRWAGKGLCRDEDGDAITDRTTGWNRRTQWYHACLGEAGHEFGYGDEYVGGLCSDDRSGAELYDTTPVDELETCVSTWPTGTIYNMSGNVQEYEDSCIGDGTADDVCPTRGGAIFFHNDGSLGCSAFQDQEPPLRKRDRADLKGIRCCWSPH